MGGGREYWADQEKRYGKEDADRYQINDRARATSFESLQFLTLKIDTTLYYVLEQIAWEGHWHYPKIREKWYQFIGGKEYIFTEAEYQKLLHLEEGKIAELRTYCMVGGNHIEAQLVHEIEEHVKELDSIPNLRPPKQFVFPVLKITVNGKTVIRFDLPGTYYTLDKKNVLCFYNGYFEVSPEEFSKLIVK